MKKVLVLLIVIILSKTLSFSKETYPQVKVINGDTIVLISPQQLKEVNKTIVERDYFESKDSVSQIEIERYKKKCVSLDLMNQFNNSKIENYEKILSNTNLESKIKDRLIEDYKKSLAKQKLRTVGMTIGGFLVGGSLGLALFNFF